MNYGVVLFDGNEPGPGWASVEGGDAVRVSGVNELSTDVLWWTNLSYDDFFGKSEAWRNAWLRHDKYLVVDPKGAVQEWGVDLDAVGTHQMCKLASAIFSRVMRISLSLVRTVARGEVAPEEAFKGKSLRDDLRPLLPDGDYPESPEEANILKRGKSFNEFTRSSVKGVRDGRMVVLRRPRVAYAAEMFQTPVPVGGPWRRCTKADLKGDRQERMRWVRDAAVPCVAEVRVDRINDEFASVFGFGNVTNRDSKEKRNWVAHPEFCLLARFSDIDVRSAFVGKEYGLITTTMAEPVRAFLQDRFIDLSWSAGIIAETLWRACSLPERRDFKNRNEKDLPHTSWQGLWLNASDKGSMFVSAMALSNLGYNVISYGLGWLRVSILPEEVQGLLKDAVTLGLLPQLSDVKAFGADRRVAARWGGDERTAGFADMLLGGETNVLWKLDALPTLPRERRNEVLARIISERRKSGPG